MDVGESLNGTKLVVRVESAKTYPQIKGWHRIVQAVTNHLNQHLQPGEPPRHESAIEEWLRTHFLGVEEVTLGPRRISSSSKRSMSEAISRLEAWVTGQGIDITSDERHHP